MQPILIITYNGISFSLIDTAGLKRRGKIKKGIEKFSSIRCLNALEKSDIALLVIDFGEPFQNKICILHSLSKKLKKELL